MSYLWIVIVIVRSKYSFYYVYEWDLYWLLANHIHTHNSCLQVRIIFILYLKSLQFIYRSTGLINPDLQKILKKDQRNLFDKAESEMNYFSFVIWVLSRSANSCIGFWINLEILDVVLIKVITHLCRLPFCIYNCLLKLENEFIDCRYALLTI